MLREAGRREAGGRQKNNSTIVHALPLPVYLLPVT
eukprot:COSAG05_NODE_77_length_21410_cov_1079.308573_13_plen_35_part_00